MLLPPLMVGLVWLQLASTWVRASTGLVVGRQDGQDQVVFQPGQRLFFWQQLNQFANIGPRKHIGAGAAPGKLAADPSPPSSPKLAPRRPAPAPLQQLDFRLLAAGALTVLALLTAAVWLVQPQAVNFNWGNTDVSSSGDSWHDFDEQRAQTKTCRPQPNTVKLLIERMNHTGPGEPVLVMDKAFFGSRTGKC